MSEFQIRVVEIGEIRKHENADSLCVTMVHGGYPCIIKTGDFKEGDKAVYCPVDSLVPLDSLYFNFLRKEGNNKQYHRVKAVRLRGIFSMGLLILADPSWEIGKDVQTELGIKKYEHPEEFHMGGENEPCLFDFPVYTDIEGFRRWGNVLEEGEMVVISEKLHGCNSRYVWKDERLWVGSHKNVKRENKDNIWWKIANNYQLSDRLKQHPDIVFYGEIYGQVQDLKYGHEKGKISVRFFDAMDLNNRKYLNYEDFRKILFAESLLEMDDLECVPILYVGPWKSNLTKLAERESMIAGANHISEGFVVKPYIERVDNKIGRVILKYVGEQYLTRKGV